MAKAVVTADVSLRLIAASFKKRGQKK